MLEIFYLDKRIKKGSLKDIKKLKRKKIWIDVNNITKEEAEVLRETFNLHPLTAEDLYNSRTRIKVEEFPEYLFCVFYGLLKGKGLETVELDFVLGKDFLITNHKKTIPSYENIKSDKERLERNFNRGMEFLMYRLLDFEVDNFFPVLEGIDDQIESIEAEITKRAKPEHLKRILNLKRKMIQLKKVSFPQREKISFLAKNEYKLISKKAIPYFRDIHDHAIRLSDMIESYREAVGNAFDVYMSAVSNSMNEVMKVLSIIATLALPLTVISGIYGTNFLNLPGASHYNGFWFMITFMIALCFGMLYFFRKRGWF